MPFLEPGLFGAGCEECPWLVVLFEKVLASEWSVGSCAERTTNPTARQMLNDNWREKDGRPILVV